MSRIAPRLFNIISGCPFPSRQTLLWFFAAAALSTAGISIGKFHELLPTESVATIVEHRDVYDSSLMTGRLTNSPLLVMHLEEGWTIERRYGGDLSKLGVGDQIVIKIGRWQDPDVIGFWVPFILLPLLLVLVAARALVLSIASYERQMLN